MAIRKSSAAVAFVLSAISLHAATLGRTIPIAGGASDIVLDERHGRVYLISSIQSQVQIYNLARQVFETPIATDQTPVSAAIARDGSRLYVTSYDGSVLDVIDLDSLLVVQRIGLPARPEGVAVAGNGTVLISTTGSGAGNTANELLLYDPSPNAAIVLSPISVLLGLPGAVTFPPPSGRPFLSVRSQLVASRNGSLIVGVNSANPLIANATVFVYESASRTVLRSRIVAGATTSVAISDDGTRILAGAILLDAATLQILGTATAANVPYPIDARTIFTQQVNQGGAVFSPDSATLYSALNVAPAVTPPAASQLMLADPDNFLVRQGIQLPDTLAGKMVLSANGANLYALSDSGFAIIPVGNIATSPLAVPATNALLLARDACGVNLATATLAINNPGTGRVTPSGQLFQIAGLPNQANPAMAPTVRPNGTQLIFTFNTAVSRGTGTVTPSHDFLISAPEAINIPDRVRVYENARDPDSRGTVVPLSIGLAGSTIALPNGVTGAPLPDLIYDAPRQRIYIANASFNRVEVYDLRQNRLLAPIKVGQIPVSMALTPDGTVLYVANAGSEHISVVDPDRLQAVGRVNFPPLAFNSAAPPILPSAIAWSQAGLMVQTTTGVLWKAVGDGAVPRTISRLIGTAAIPISSMASTPAGDFVLIAASSGNAYLYDASIDDFVAQRTVFNPAAQTGYVGPIAAGPQGRYFVLNGTLLNQALSPVRPALGLVSAVAPVGAASYAIFSPPAAAANALPTTAPTVQILDATAGLPQRTASALEGPISAPVAGGRALAAARTMAIDAAGTTAYVVTASGLSIVPLTAVAASDRPAPFARGAVNLGSYQTAIAPNGLMSIFGQNLGATEVAGSAPLPIVLGGTCVTLNNIALPLFMVSPGQINAQIPPETVAGNYPLVVRSLTNRAASTTQQLAVSKYAPAVLVAPNGQPAIFHDDGPPVDRDNPAQRDRVIVMYAVGLGAPAKGRVTSGNLSPTSPLAETADVQVFFGDPRYKQSEVIVDWSGLTPGFIGLYQLNLRVPGFHEKGDALPVTIRIGNIDSPTTGPVVPYVAVE